MPLALTGRQPGIQSRPCTLARVGRSRGIGILFGGRSCCPPGWRSRGRCVLRLIRATPEGNPAAEETPAEAEAYPNVQPLASWADEAPDPSSTFDWAPPPPRPPTPKSPLANAAFGLTLVGIAVGAFFVGRQYHAYNRAREAAHMTMGPQAAAAVETPAAAMRHHREHQEEVKRHEHDAEQRSVDAQGSASEEEGSAASVTPPLPPLPQEQQEKAGKQGMLFEIDEGLGVGPVALHPVPAEEPAAAQEEEAPSPPPPPAGEEKKEEVQAHTAVSVPETKPHEPEATPKAAPEVPAPAPTPATAPRMEKLPLRTPEANAALARIRALQERRNQLYDRAIARQDSKDESEGASPFAAAAAPTADAIKSTETHIEAASQTGHASYDAWVITEAARQVSEEAAAGAAAPPVIPPGMTLNALRDRANAANKAAAASAASAHRAAAASAMAADAADNAAQLAARAAAAAERCQGALDLRRGDAIEAAYKEAAEAEAAADAAVRTAAVGAAKAVMSESDAGRQSGAAEAAADLSRPRGVVAQASAAWRTARRGAAAAATGAQEAWSEAGHRVQGAGEAAVNGAKGAWAALQQRVTGGGPGPAEK